MSFEVNFNTKQVKTLFVELQFLIHFRNLNNPLVTPYLTDTIGLLFRVYNMLIINE